MVWFSSFANVVLNGFLLSLPNVIFKRFNAVALPTWFKWFGLQALHT
jgi:hypothetical protein